MAAEKILRKFAYGKRRTTKRRQPKSLRSRYHNIMKEEQVNISLVSVSEVEGATAINRSALRRLGRKPVSVDMNVRVVPDIKRNFISLVVSCTYIGVVSLVRTRLMVCSVICTFEIEDLDKHIVSHGDEVVVASPLMMTMLGIAVGSLRGIVSVRTASTPLRYRPLPIIDLNALMYRLHYGKTAADTHRM